MSAVVKMMLSPGEAQRLTQRIKLTAGTVRDGLFKLRNLVDEARDSNAWQVLGFASWTAYLSDTLASEPMRLERSERQTLVEYLSGEGLSTRAIAPIVGASQRTVADDVSKIAHLPESEPVAIPDDSEAIQPTDAPVAVNPSTGEVIDAPVNTEHTITEKTKTVVGLDGKSYSAPKKREPKPVMTHEQAVRDNAEQLSSQFGASLVNLQGLTNETYRARVIEQWRIGFDAATWDAQELANPESFRAIAVALDQLADEWEKSNG